ncbi:MAG: hypothetical protein AAB706_02460 [Patescibacteria group bacterium]
MKKSNPTTPLPEECIKEFEKEFVMIMPRKNKDSLMLLGAGWDNWLRFFLHQSYEQGKREMGEKIKNYFKEQKNTGVLSMGINNIIYEIDALVKVEEPLLYYRKHRFNFQK